MIYFDVSPVAFTIGSVQLAWLGIDFIRPGRELLFGPHEAQLIAIVVLVISLTLLITRTRRVKKDDGELKGNQEVP